jgi:hypothetical protein
LPFPPYSHPQQRENPNAQSDSQEPPEGHPVVIILRTFHTSVKAARKSACATAGLPGFA